MMRLASALLLALCATFGAAAVQVTDDANNVVTLDQPAKRVISLLPHATELLFDIGAGPALVGVDEYSNYPAAAQDIPRVGDYFALNLEVILALQPDLIIAWPNGNSAAQLERLAAFNIPVYLSDPQNVGMIVENLRDLGRLTDQSDRAEQVAMGFEDAMKDLQRRFSDREPVRVFYQVWHDPIFTISGDNFIGELITYCGGVNVFADAPVLAPQVGRESVLAANPEVILGGGSDGTGLDIWRTVTDLSAVRQGHLYTLNTGHLSRPTLGLVTGGEALCTTIDRARAQ
ncbi:cobalamin-binding protein [Salinispirillum marinum]|uniref:Cobalamin-binding protein n=2 Tax=Saccharospirillaceae TaxID=255527 RepID=A0ABV8BBW2_9GAMM